MEDRLIQRAAVTGATGLIGERLCQALIADGCEVAGLSRRPAALAPPIRALGWDPAQGPLAASGLVGCDAIVHLAGASIGGRWTKAYRDELRRSRIDSTRVLVEAIARTEPRPSVLVSASAIGIYGDRGDEVLDENASAGSGFLADLTRAWEAEAQRASALGVRVAMLRSGVVLARKGGALPRIVAPFRVGFGGRLGDGEQWFSWIHVDDLVAAIKRILVDPSLSGPVNATAPEPVRNRELARAIGEVLGRPAVLPTPGFALKLVLGKERAEELLLSGQRVVPRALLQAGFSFEHTDIRSALADCLSR